VTLPEKGDKGKKHPARAGKKDVDGSSGKRGRFGKMGNVRKKD